MIIRMRKNDLGYNLTITCTDENGDAINLTNVTTATLKIGRIGESSNLVEEAMTVSDAANGVCTVDFESGEIDTAGYYDACIHLLYSNDDERTLKPFTFQILPSL